MTIATVRSVADLLPVALRDTAGTVAALRSSNPPALDDLRGQCDAQIAGLRDELQRRGHARDVIDDALYAQCALLDEAALGGLGAAARDDWEREPLQVRVFEIEVQAPEPGIMVSFTMKCHLHKERLVRFDTVFTPDGKTRLRMLQAALDKY